jgi:hypothetical protein
VEGGCGWKSSLARDTHIRINKIWTAFIDMRKTRGKRKERWFFTFGFAFFSLCFLRPTTDPIDKQQQAKQNKSIYLCMVIGRMPQQLKYILLFFSFYFWYILWSRLLLVDKSKKEAKSISSALSLPTIPFFHCSIIFFLQSNSFFQEKAQEMGGPRLSQNVCSMGEFLNQRLAKSIYNQSCCWFFFLFLSFLLDFHCSSCYLPINM